MRALADWLTATAACRWLQDKTADWPLFLASVQLLHLIGVALIIAVAGLVAAGLWRSGADDEALPAFARRATPWVAIALVVQLATGVFLIVRWPSRILLSPVFLPKLGLIAVGVALLLVIARRLGSPAAALKPGTAAARTLGLLLILAWTAVVFAGRWIPFA